MNTPGADVASLWQDVVLLRWHMSEETVGNIFSKAHLSLLPLIYEIMSQGHVQPGIIKQDLNCSII